MREQLDRWLPPGTAQRSVAGVVGSLVAAFVVLRFGLPAGTPLGVLLSGGIAGARASLLAAGIVLVYRSQRFINFSQAALGAVGATVTFNLGAVVGVPFVLSVLVGFVLSVAFGIVVELIFVRRFFRSPRLVLTVVTIVLSTVLPGIALQLERLPLWPTGRRVNDIRAAATYRGPFAGFRIDVDPFGFGFPDILTVVVVVVAFSSLAAFLRFSKMGTAIRGSAENADRALLLGINVGFLSTVVWGICGALAGSYGILVGLGDNWRSSSGNAQLLVLPLTAAVLARMKSLPVVVVSSIALEMGRLAFRWSYPKSTKWDLVLLTIVCVGLLVQRSRSSRVDEGLSSSWKATQEIRPTPQALLALPGVRRVRRALLVAGACLLLVYPQASSPGVVLLASLIPVYVLIALSLVVLTGWGGQVSLGQVGFVAVGELVGAKLASGAHLPMLLGFPLTVVVCGGVAALVGLPALRLRGPFLAVTTFAFALVVAHVLLNANELPWLQTEHVSRPSLFFIGFSDERSWYYLSVLVAVVAAVVVRRLRAGRPGRVLIALREDDKGLQTFAIDVVRTRLSVFMLSGALAGAAGWLRVFHDAGVGDPDQVLGAGESVQAFIMAMTGGITSVSGAALGATFFGLTEILTTDQGLQVLSQGLPLLLLLFVAPGGFAELVYRLRDSILRLVAIRRRIVVPTLFADADADVLHGQKTAFAEPADGRGLDALPPERRYELGSELYPAGAAR